MGLAKRQRSGFCQTHLWAKSKREQAQRRPLLSFRGAKEEEGVRERSQLQTLYSELDFRLSCSAGGSDLTWSAPSEACACFYDCLSCRQGRNGERLGHLRVSWWGRSHTSFQNSSMQGNEMEIQPYKIRVEAGAVLGELRCSGWVTHVRPLEAAAATYIPFAF